MSPAQMGLLFHPTTPRLVCCNDFKGGSKARCSSSTPRSCEDFCHRHIVYVINGDLWSSAHHAQSVERAARNGSPSLGDHPGLVCCNNFQSASKPAAVARL